MKSIKFYFFILSISLLFTSCSKEEKESIVPEPEVPVCKLISEEDNASNSKKRNVVYDALGRPTFFNDTWFEYDNSNKLVKRKFEFTGVGSGSPVQYQVTTTFTWRGNVLLECVEEFRSTQLISKKTQKFTTDTKNRIVAATITEENYRDNKNSQTNYTFFYNAAGNVEKVTFKINNSTTSTVWEINYDNKKGPNEFYKILYPEDFSYFSKNNVLSAKQDGKPTSSQPIVYVYNDKGYAIQKKINSNGFDFITTYYYECK